MYWLVLILIALVCLHLYQRLTSRRHRKMLDHLPSWPALPFIGSMYKVFRGGFNLMNYYEQFSEIMETTNLPFVFWAGNKAFLVLSDPEHVRTVATTNLEKSYIYSFAKTLVGNGLITASGAVWKKNVKKLGSVFTMSMIDSFQDVFNYQSEKLIKSLEAVENGPPCNIEHTYLSDAIFRILCESFLGINGDDIIDQEIIESFQRASKLLTERILNIHLHPDAIYRLTPASKELDDCIKKVHKMTESVLKRKLSVMNNCNSNEENPDCKKPSSKYFETLLKMKETDPTFTDEAIKHELTTLLLTGHESTSFNINLILLILGRRSDVQQKLYNEIRSVLGNSKCPVSQEDLISFSYCEAVILEALRLYPTAPVVLRCVDHDVKLKSCTVPSGVTCLFHLWSSGRSKRFWGDDALEYNPERWLDPSMATKRASMFITFGIGKRACIGKRYAINLIKTLLVHCVREYEFFSEADTSTFYVNLILYLKTGNRLQIRRREKM